MASNTVWQFIQRLRKRTDAGKVNWEKTVEDEVYQASFPNYTVRILQRHSESGVLDIVVQILDGEGAIVEENSDVDLRNVSDLGNQGTFNVMNALYKSARRKAMGIDRALEEIMNSLGDDGDDLES